MDLIAKACKKTCGNCEETSTEQLTSDETTSVKETSLTETTTTLAGIFLILQKHAFDKSFKFHLDIYVYD